MSKQANGIFPLTIASCAAATTANRFVTATGAVPAADANVLGVVRQTSLINTAVTVDVLGTAIVEAGAAITAGSTLKVDATGKAITWATSGAKVGLALQAASASGDLIEVLLVQNVA